MFENKNCVKLSGVNTQLINNYSNEKANGANTGRRRLMKRTQLEAENTDKNFLKREVVDPVWLINEYKPQIISIEEAMKNHIEMAHTDILNNPQGYVSVRLFLDMTTKKKAKFMDNIKGAVYFPNTFKEGIQKEVVAICKVKIYMIES